MEPKCFVVGHVPLHCDLSDSSRVSGGIADPGFYRCRLEWSSLSVEQVQSAVRNVELVDRIDEPAAHRRLLELSDARCADQLLRGTEQRIVELLRDLVTDDDEQSATEQDDDQAERRYVPDCESQAESDEPLNSAARRGRFNRQSDTRLRAQSGSI